MGIRQYVIKGMQLMMLKSSYTYMGTKFFNPFFLTFEIHIILLSIVILLCKIANQNVLLPSNFVPIEQSFPISHFLLFFL